MTTPIRTLLICTAGALMAACGGGGSSTPAATDFPLLAAYKANIVAGQTRNVSVSGTCGGTGTITDSAAVAATFEGVNGYSATSTLTLNLTNCSQSTLAASGTTYYDANYTILGSVVPGTLYAKVASVPPPLPTTVKVGDTAIYATLTDYTDSSKTTLKGQEILSYVIEADSSSTAIANAITRTYDTSNNLLSTQQTRYRIDASGGFTLVSIDVQYSTTSTTHLLLTAV
jgi:hypothetical protein